MKFANKLCLGFALLFATATAAIAQTGPTVVEVKAGDSFSSLAARITGNASTWRQLYRADATGLRNVNVVSKGMRFELVTDPKGGQYLRLLNGAAPTAPRPLAPAAKPVASSPTVAPTVPPAPAGDETLLIGVLPNIPANILSTQYEGLKRYLERVTPQKVRVVIPASFKDFYDSMLKGEYDLAVSAPHFARVAQADRNMQPLVIYEPRINALLVAPSESAITSAAELRGKAVGFANPQSLVAMYGQQWLRRQNLEAGKDYEVKAARTDFSVGRMMLVGDAVAAMMSNGEFRALPPAESSRLKIVEIFARMPNFIVLAHPRLERQRVARLKASLKEFLTDKEDGVAFASATGFSGIVDADENQMRELDLFVGQTRQIMGPPNK